MSKKLFICFIAVFFILMPVSAYAQTTKNFKTEGMEISYTLPSRWGEIDSGADGFYFYKEYTPMDEVMNFIYVMAVDMWEDYENEGIYTRSDINNDFFVIDDFAVENDSTVDSISEVVFNGIDYDELKQTEVFDWDGEEAEVSTVTYYYINNAVAYTFIYEYYNGDDTYYEDFLSLMDSVVYTDVAETGAALVEESVAPTIAYETDYYGFNGWYILSSLIITILLYSFPIIVYRYVIRKKPVEPGKAKKITIIYAICAYIVMAVLMFALGGTAAEGGAIFLWSFINYAMLTCGYKKYMETKDNMYGGIPPHTMVPPDVQKDVHAGESDTGGEALSQSLESAKEEATPLKNETDGKFCVHCGKKIPEYSHFCPECSARQEEMIFSYDPPKEIYCAQCGKKIPEYSHFCPKCGAERKEK